jgi:oligopeptide/dipeptide ABC transporter ATP-binding protein
VIHAAAVSCAGAPPPGAEQLALRVDDLSVLFPAGKRVVQAVDRVSFGVRPGETLGLVGESGCGKSATLRAVMGLIAPPAEIVSGVAELHGRDLIAMGDAERRVVRGRSISMVFQDAGASLNPVFSVGEQLAELARLKLGLGRRQARAQALELLARVGIPAAAERLESYPHQLSGGMRQRVMIAMAIACSPQVLLADEPTTALDVTIQDQILRLLADLQAELGMAMVLVSHDLGVVAEVCDTIAVMYAGRIVEHGAVEEVLGTPRHPYTRALLAAEPTVETVARSRLMAIDGQPPDLTAIPPGCSFAPRCLLRIEACAQAPMTLDREPPEHGSACIRPEAASR